MTLAQRLEAAGIVKGGHYRVTFFDYGADHAGATYRTYGVNQGGRVTIDGQVSAQSAFDLIALLDAAEDGRVLRIADPAQAAN